MALFSESDTFQLEDSAYTQSSSSVPYWPHNNKGVSSLDQSIYMMQGYQDATDQTHPCNLGQNTNNVGVSSVQSSVQISMDPMANATPDLIQETSDLASTVEGESDGEVEESKRGISYAQSLFECLMSSAPKFEMELKDIYQWYARNTVRGRKTRQQTAWKNSIRHNLSMSEEFQKGSRTGGTNRNMWHLSDRALQRGKILPTTRFRRNGNAIRRRRRNSPAAAAVNSTVARRESGSLGGKASRAARNAAAQGNGHGPSVPQIPLPSTSAAAETWTPSPQIQFSAVAIPSSAQATTFNPEPTTVGPPLSELLNGNDMNEPDFLFLLEQSMDAVPAASYGLAAAPQQSEPFDFSMNQATPNQIGSCGVGSDNVDYCNGNGNLFGQDSDATLSSATLAALPSSAYGYDAQQAWAQIGTTGEDSGLDGTALATENFFDSTGMTQGDFEVDFGFEPAINFDT